MAETYNRDKAFAILSGIVAFLIVLGGTILGSYDAITRLALVGILPAACYLIADLVNCWAIYIDYKEDGTALEWTAMATKAALSLYLLFVGGLVAHRLSQEQSQGQGSKDRLEAYQKVYNDCIERTPKALTTCRKLAESRQAEESKFVGKETEQKKLSAEAYDKLLNWPLFHYTPGFLGFFFLILLNLVKKLSRKLTEASVSLSDEPVSLSDEPVSLQKLSESARKLTQSESKAYLSLSKPSDGQTYFSKDGKRFLKLIPQASGFQLRSEKNVYQGHIGWKAYEKLQVQGITYEKLLEYCERKNIDE